MKMDIGEGSSIQFCGDGELRTILVTGGAGFIGSCFVRRRLAAGDRVINYDKLTYAGHVESVPEFGEQHILVQADICDAEQFAATLADYQPNSVVHFAAESHVDRSIDGPAEFIRTNVNGTCTILEASLHYFRQLSSDRQEAFRYLHVSTDEVYGSLGDEGVFTEETPYAPNSPYSASKASSDLFARAYEKTFGLPTLISNCSNNYGPYQFPEKLIPLMVLNALEGRDLPIYGDGKNIRDWLYVEDHCAALERILESGRIGQTYNVGGNTEKSNLQIVHAICTIVDRLQGRASGVTEKQIRFVEDRPGHDRRYAVGTEKIRDELGWQPAMTFEQGLEQTIRWYVENAAWLSAVTAGKYDRERLGQK
jgi:dTDP-glucose 4,6-dehydratase